VFCSDLGSSLWSCTVVSCLKTSVTIFPNKNSNKSSPKSFGKSASLPHVGECTFPLRALTTTTRRTSCVIDRAAFDNVTRLKQAASLTERDNRLAHYFALFYGLGLLLGYLSTSGAKSDVIFLFGDPDFLQKRRNFAPISLTFRDLPPDRQTDDRRVDRCTRLIHLQCASLNIGVQDN